MDNNMGVAEFSRELMKKKKFVRIEEKWIEKRDKRIETL